MEPAPAQNPNRFDHSNVIFRLAGFKDSSKFATCSLTAWPAEVNFFQTKLGSVVSRPKFKTDGKLARRTNVELVEPC